MPLYEYHCVQCDKSRVDIRTVAERHLGPKCDACREPMKLEISAVNGVVSNPAVPKRNSRAK